MTGAVVVEGGVEGDVEPAGGAGLGERAGINLGERGGRNPVFVGAIENAVGNAHVDGDVFGAHATTIDFGTIERDVGDGAISGEKGGFVDELGIAVIGSVDERYIAVITHIIGAYLDLYGLGLQRRERCKDGRREEGGGEEHALEERYRAGGLLFHIVTVFIIIILVYRVLYGNIYNTPFCKYTNNI